MKNISPIIIIIIFISLVYLLAVSFNQKKESSCVNNTKSFLSWYKENFSKISAGQNALIELDSNENYNPRYDNIESFISLFRTSNYFSETFLSKFKNHIIKSADNLLLNKQNDGPPEGFDHDFFFGLEYSYYLELIPDKISIKSIRNENQIKTVLVAEYIEYTFNQSCKIEDIGRNGESFY